MLTLHLEGGTIDELRAKAIEVLDLQLGLNREEATEHVEKLQAEPVSETTEADVSDAVEQPDPVQAAAPAEKPARKPRGKAKEKPAATTTVVSDFAKETEAAADAEDLAQPAKLNLDSVRTAFDAYVQ